jgi:YHS domain-containing protein
MCGFFRVKRIRSFQLYLRLAITGSLLLLSFNISADHKMFLSKQGVVIYGFDPVAYFTVGKAIEGSKDISLEFLGGTWRFASEENRELFLADPGSYIPQYGGHCAWGIKTDGHIEPEPKSWRIVDGKLYLYYNHAANSRWNKTQTFVGIANRKWEEQKAILLQP